MSDSMLPNKWRAGVFSDIAEVNPAVAVAELCADTPVSFLTMADVSESGRILNHQIRPLCEVRAGFTRFEEDDVLFAKITPCMQNGKGAFARKLSNQHGFGSTEFHVLRATEIGDAEFIYHLAQSSEVRSKAVTFFTGSAGQQRVDSKFFSCFNLLIPPLAQQRKFARILTTLDNVIAQTEALIAKYQAIKQGLMHDLFTRGVDATGKLRPPQSEAPELYKQSELGWIPKEWEVVRLIEIAEVKGGKRLPAGQPFANAPTAFPYIRVSDMRDWSIDASAIEYVPDHIEPFIRQYKISSHDLYISIAGVYLGLVGMVPTSLDNAQLTENAAKIVLRDKEAHRNEFLTAFFHSSLFSCQLEQVKGIGSGVPKLALHRIEAFTVPTPHSEEQNRIAESLMQIRALITKEREAVSKAKNEKNGLMQDLLTGKVPVKADEPEEIAS